MRAVVLGAGGFVGRHLCGVLAARGALPVAVVRNAPGSPVDGAVRTRVLDAAAAPGPLAGLLRQEAPDVVVNAAGAVWGAGEAQMLESNVVLVEQLLAALRGLDRRPRLIQLGTVHEYGAAPAGGVLTEDTPAAPVNPYGRTKLCATEAVLAAVREGAVDAVVLRVANVVGPGGPPGSLLGMVGGRLAEAHAEDRRARVRLASLGGHRDVVDVRDLGDAVLAAIAARPAPPLVNIGGGRAVAVDGLVRRLIEISGVPTDLVVEDRQREDRQGADREAHAAGTISPGSGARRQQLDISLAAEALGWRPVHSPEESLHGLWASLADPTKAAI
jgi:dTDP-6-deoxy-L-talose 4-dehydrogenase [NAD(P)+]